MYTLSYIRDQHKWVAWIISHCLHTTLPAHGVGHLPKLVGNKCSHGQQFWAELARTEGNFADSYYTRILRVNGWIFPILVLLFFPKWIRLDICFQARLRTIQLEFNLTSVWTHNLWITIRIFPAHDALAHWVTSLLYHGHMYWASLPPWQKLWMDCNESL